MKRELQRRRRRTHASDGVGGALSPWSPPRRSTATDIALAVLVSGMILLVLFHVSILHTYIPTFESGQDVGTGFGREDAQLRGVKSFPENFSRNDSIRSDVYADTKTNMDTKSRNDESNDHAQSSSYQYQLLPSSIWATRALSSLDSNIDTSITTNNRKKNVNDHNTTASGTILHLLTDEEIQKSLKLCGKFLYSTLDRAIHVKDMGQDVFVATGDINAMWTRDSVVQMTIYLNYNQHLQQQHQEQLQFAFDNRKSNSNSNSDNNKTSPSAAQQGQSLPPSPLPHSWLRFLVEGAIRRNAFNILQDPYANAYEHRWKDPTKLALKDQIIGRGGYVATRNYELDSGAYFLTHLYDYFRSPSMSYRPERLLEEPMIYEAVMLMIQTWKVEQHHDTLSAYRYFELPNQGKGSPTAYTGMTWTGFRPSDDACQYGYLIPANIHAAGALQRVLILNERIWQSDELQTMASQLLSDIEEGIRKYGIIETNNNGERIYAYEVDGKGNSLHNFDDANIPSLLSIPLLGWDGYDREVYQNTRKYLLSTANRQSYFQGSTLTGIGSPHTPNNYIWPMAMVIQGLTAEGPDVDEQRVFQLRQLLLSATKDAMHESVHKDTPARYTRDWFEWANALFVVYVETVTGQSCASTARDNHLQQTIAKVKTGNPNYFYKTVGNDPWNPGYYQEIEASVHFD